MIKILEAGVDQFGGEAIPELLIELVQSGDVSEDRLDASARRLLREKFVLGLFDAPLVDVEKAGGIVGSAAFRAAGEAAQRASITVLTNTATDAGTPALPLATRPEALRRGHRRRGCGGVRHRRRDPGRGRRRDHPHPGAVRGARDVVRELLPPGFARLHRRDHRAPARGRGCRSDRASTCTSTARRSSRRSSRRRSSPSLVANYGANARALLDVLTGAAQPKGKLPFDLPSSMAAVEASREDVPFDTKDPLFRFGHGLAY